MKKWIFSLCIALLASGCTDSDWIGDGNVTYAPQQLTLSKSELSGLILGETRMLYASFTPAETTQNGIEWSSSDPEIVAFIAVADPEDDNETATAEYSPTAEGAVVRLRALAKTADEEFVTITARSTSRPDLTASCTVTVTEDSGIRIVEVLSTGEENPLNREDPVVFFRNSADREYKVEVYVHNTFDKSLAFESSNEDVVTVEGATVGGEQGFILHPQNELETATVTVRSTQNDDVWTDFTVTLTTVHVTGIEARKPDSATSESGNWMITAGHDQIVEVYFSTDDPTVSVPEETGLTAVSSNPAIVQVSAEPVWNELAKCARFALTVTDDPELEGQTASVTITSKENDQINIEIPVEVQVPHVKGISIRVVEHSGEACDVTVTSEDGSQVEPVHAGESIRFEAVLEPADAYFRDVVWSLDGDSTTDLPGIADISEDGMLYIDSDLTAFKPDQCEQTEFSVVLKSTDPQADGLAAKVKIRPYNYVEATGVIITDQWGNRMRGTSSTDRRSLNACIMYCCGGTDGKESSTPFNSHEKDWGIAVGAEGLDNVGSIPVYLTATPIPYTYPTIADPDQHFYWASRYQRFAVAGKEDPEGNTNVYWTEYNQSDGRGNTTELFLGHTCKFWTGHRYTGDDQAVVWVWRYKEGPNGSGNKRDADVLIHFMVLVANKGGYGSRFADYNTSLIIDDNSSYAFKYLNEAGLPDKDASEWKPWDGPLPKIGKYHKLDESGQPIYPAVDWDLEYAGWAGPKEVNDKNLIP